MNEYSYSSDLKQRILIFGHLSLLDELDNAQLSCEARVVLLYIVFHLDGVINQTNLEHDLAFDVSGALTELQQKDYLACN